MIPHYDTAGDGPRVLLIQGTGVAGCAWSPQVEGLRDRFELAWFDNRGTGSTPGTPTSMDDLVDDALAVLDALGWEHAHVAGHSLGGVIAQCLALRAPDRVDSLALLCTFARGRAALPSSLADFGTQVRTSLGTADMRRRAFFEMVSHPDVPPEPQNIEVIEQAFGRRLHELPSAAMAQLRILLATDLRPHLSALRGPVLVACGTHDRLAPPEQSRLLAEATGVELHEIDGGHALTIQAADTVNRLLAAHWRKAQRPGRVACRAPAGSRDAVALARSIALLGPVMLAPVVQ